MSEENDRAGFKMIDLDNGKQGVMLSGVMSVEKADEECKNIGENEIGIEVNLRIGNGVLRSRTKMPSFLTGKLDKIAAVIVRDMLDKTHERAKASEAFDAGFKAGQEAAAKRQTPPADEQKPDNTPTPEQPASGTEAPAAE